MLPIMKINVESYVTKFIVKLTPEFKGSSNPLSCVREFII